MAEEKGIWRGVVQKVNGDVKGDVEQMGQGITVLLSGLMNKNRAGRGFLGWQLLGWQLLGGGRRKTLPVRETATPK